MNLFKRGLVAAIRPFIKRKEAIFIRGVRRVGKTSLLLLLQNELIRKYKIKKENIYFFDLEDLAFREDFNEKPENLLKYLNLSDRQKKYIFIDEIQYLDNPSNFIKILVDHHPQLKIFASGSSSLDIKRKIQDSLVGRVFYFQLYPLNFSEFLFFKKKNGLLKPTEKLTPNQTKELDKLLAEYLTYGGMPEVVLEGSIYLKEEILKNYLNLYITKDIRSIVEIENLNAFNKIAKILAGQIGNLLNKSELANTLNISFLTVEKYLNVLEYSYFIILLSPYFVNLRSRLTKTQKVFLYDLGLRNALINNFSDFDFRPDKGALFENFIFLELAHIFGKEEINFYRSAHKSEIDFIVEPQKLAIEAKCVEFRQPRVFRVFDAFPNFQNLVVNRNFSKKLAKYSFLDWRDFLIKLSRFKKCFK